MVVLRQSTIDNHQSSINPPDRVWRRLTAALWKRRVLGFVGIAVLTSAAALIPATHRRRDSGPFTTHRVTRGDLVVSVMEHGTLESSNNTEIKCRVRGDNTIIWIVESGTQVKPGDELVRLDTLFIEEQISERTKFFHLSTSAADRSKADVTAAELAIKEYEQGTFVSELALRNKALTIARSKLLSAKNMLSYSKMMADSGYVSELEVEEREFMVSQADLDVKLIRTQIDVLKRFTKEEQWATLRGNLKAAEARHNADKERAYADKKRLERAEEELGFCVIKAPRAGMVIYPTGEQWEETPDIEEGATVHKDQVLLLMPDLTRMQVKVGIHESIIKRVKPGLPAQVTLPGGTIDVDVKTVATVAEPAGWWTGNVVKYDTAIELPEDEQGLKPGMSVEVEVIIARYQNVLTVPTTAVMETNNGHACWVETNNGTERRTVQLVDSNERFLVVDAGLKEADQVVVNPLNHIKEAQTEAAQL